MNNKSGHIECTGRIFSIPLKFLIGWHMHHIVMRQYSC